jgi:hypothetical protein
MSSLKSLVIPNLNILLKKPIIKNHKKTVLKFKNKEKRTFCLLGHYRLISGIECEENVFLKDFGRLDPMSP